MHQNAHRLMTLLQFNAVINLATANGTNINIYAGSWTGPLSPKFLGDNQTTGTPLFYFWSLFLTC
jgi:hypothetical protein